MTDFLNKKLMKAGAMLNIAPPMIRKSLLSEESFKEEYGFMTEPLVDFCGGEAVFHRKEFFDLVRSVLSNGRSCELTDTNDQVWILSNEERDEELPQLLLSSGNKQLVLPDFSMLSTSHDIRMRFLEETAMDLNLRCRDLERWRTKLETCPIEDHLISAFHSDMRNTPVYLQRICSDLVTEGCSVFSLVPNSRKYYERLVGVYDRSESVYGYAASVGSSFIQSWLDWHTNEGFLFSLYLSSHSSLTKVISTDNLSREEMKQNFVYLEAYGDVQSQVGAIEVGLRVLSTMPEIEPLLLRLVRKIRDDDVDKDDSRFALFSALFVLVDGELARSRLFAMEPPFFRRLAGLAQAALISRSVIEREGNCREFTDWAIRFRREEFYIQSLSDMRIEPRWNPSLSAASQIQADFLGRIMKAGSDFQENLGQGELRDIIIGDGEKSLIKHGVFLTKFFAGPLEGGENNPNSLPDNIATFIEDQLRCDEIEANSFIVLQNSAMIFNVKKNHTELVVDALRLCNYTLSNLDSKNELLSVLNGLATVAAISRSAKLADELRILVRRYRQDPQFGFSIDEAISLYLVAAAAREDTKEWREFVGECFTELAFSDLKGDDGEVFHSLLLTLLHSKPDLWATCARADAALIAWRDRNKSK